MSLQNNASQLLVSVNKTSKRLIFKVYKDDGRLQIQYFTLFKKTYHHIQDRHISTVTIVKAELINIFMYPFNELCFHLFSFYTYTTNNTCLPLGHLDV